MEPSSGLWEAAPDEAARGGRRMQRRRREKGARGTPTLENTVPTPSSRKLEASASWANQSTPPRWLSSASAPPSSWAPPPPPELAKSGYCKAAVTRSEGRMGLDCGDSRRCDESNGWELHGADAREGADSARLPALAGDVDASAYEHAAPNRSQLANSQ
ncbi:Os01g0622400 [Oryza sativa Japonica Group]|uniref:Os01g0622400 protein n=1 Tax=Oryza sativa subsp. japonica TaxID=39947 RepID=Q0JL53_ORYSJ|nr:Os01g0622400 [Oryza sativa Japonica Group]|eukprot:NP_001043611.1 Os01g0622400 [Oryza sativa Japonica Group]